MRGFGHLSDAQYGYFGLNADREGNVARQAKHLLKTQDLLLVRGADAGVS